MSDAEPSVDSLECDVRAEEPSRLLECEECLDPAEAFSMLGDDTRLSILEALWQIPDRPVSFSELRRHVGARDSAQFNYHLQKLTGQFVKKTDDGYDFRGAGRAVIQAVLSGSLNRDPEIEPFEVDGECIDCDTGLRARYANERFAVGCPDCDRTYVSYDFPPGGLEGRSREAALEAFDQRARHLSCLSADGVCPGCNGSTDVRLGDDGGDASEERDRCEHLDVYVEHECERCGYDVRTSVGTALLDDAEVVSFYRDHDIDINRTPIWTLEWCISDRYTDVLEVDPWRVRLGIELHDELLEIVLDGELNVVRAERRSA